MSTISDVAPGNDKPINVSMTKDQVYLIGLKVGLPDIGRNRYTPLIVLQVFLWFMRDRRVSDSIGEQIRALEGIGPPTSTGPPRLFHRMPLKGLWHQHFLMPDAVIRNLGIEWGLNRQGNHRLDEELATFFVEHHGEYMDDVAGDLAHRLVIGGHEQRSRERRMTGEWIVFGESGGRRYYLTLADHAQEDQAILNTIRRAGGSGYDLLRSTQVSEKNAAALGDGE